MAEDVVPGTRGTIVPAAQYTDGEYHLAWPGLIQAPFEGFQNMWERGDEANITNPDALAQSSRESFDAAGLAATGGLAAGVAGGLPESALAVNAAQHGLDPQVYQALLRAADERYSFLSSIPDGQQPTAVNGQPFSARMYRGSGRSTLYDKNETSNPPWASSSPREAHTYTEDHLKSGDAQVAPLDVRFSNPMVVDAGGHDWSGVPFDGEFMSTDDVVRRTMRSRPDVDGVVFQNVIENTDGRTTSARAIHRGTVHSPLTGEQLYSGPYGLGQKFRNMLTGGSDVGAVPEGAVAANGIGGKLRGWFGRGETAPEADDVYANILREAQASESADDAILAQLPQGTMPDAVSGQPFSARMYRGSHKTSSLYDDSVDSNPPWASSSPREAHTYAMDGGTSGTEANVAPLDFRFSNPVVVDAQRRDWTKSSSGRWTDDIVRDVTASQPNVDGVVFKNIIENLDEPSVTARAIHRGTVFSPLTGKQLYSNSPNAASVPLAMQAAERGAPTRVYRGEMPGHQPPGDYRWLAGSRDEASNYGDVVSEYDFAPRNLADLTAMSDPKLTQMVDEYAQQIGMSPAAFKKRIRGGELWADGGSEAGLLDSLRDAGYDGAKVPDINDLEFSKVSKSYVALGPGTLYNPKTGELLYSNNGSAASVPLALNAMEKPKGFTGRIYRGVGQPQGPNHYNDRGGQLWGSSSPDQAAVYAQGEAPNILPLDADFSNPLVVDAQGNRWDMVPYDGDHLETNEIAWMAAQAGHDGAVFKNVREESRAVPTDTVVALRPGTVKSATTGDQIFSNNGSAASVPLAMQAMERGGPASLAAEKQALVASLGQGNAASYLDQVGYDLDRARVFAQVMNDQDAMTVLNSPGVEQPVSRLRDIGTEMFEAERQPRRDAIAEAQRDAPVYGQGQYRLRPSDEGFDILRDGEVYGSADIQNTGSSAFINNIDTSGGSNAMGLSGLRDLREAYREFAPDITNFSGSRRQEMKTGQSYNGSVGAGAPARRKQSVDLFASHPFASASPLAFTDYEDQPQPYNAMARDR